MAKLKLFRQYSEHDVINLFSPSGADTPTDLDNGTCVSATGNGWKNGPAADLEMIGAPGLVSPILFHSGMVFRLTYALRNLEMLLSGSLFTMLKRLMRTARSLFSIRVKPLNYRLL